MGRVGGVADGWVGMGWVWVSKEMQSEGRGGDTRQRQQRKRQRAAKQVGKENMTGLLFSLLLSLPPKQTGKETGQNRNRTSNAPGRNPLTGNRAANPKFSIPYRIFSGAASPPRVAVSAWVRDAVQAACVRCG